MNAKERAAVRSLIAEWEWSGGVSASEAVTRGSCAHSLRDALRISEADLLFDRLWEMGSHLKRMYEEVYIGIGWSHEEKVRSRGFHWPKTEAEEAACRDAIDELCTEVGYDALCDMIDSDSDALMKEILGRSEKYIEDHT